MYVKVRLKHLLIPCIVFGISFISIVFNSQQLISNKTLDVGFVLATGDVIEPSKPRMVWDAISTYSIFEEQSEYTNVSVEYVKSTGSKFTKINEIASRSEIVFLYGYEVTDELMSIITNQSETEFVLIDENSDIQVKNLTTINLDIDMIIKNAVSKLTKTITTHNYLFVDTKVIDSDFELFKSEILKVDPKAVVTHYYIEDTTFSVDIMSSMHAYFDQGYDSIYINDPELNKIIVEVGRSYQLDIENYKIEQLAKQQIIDEQQTESDESDKTIVDPVDEVEPTKYLFDQVKIVTSGYNNIYDGVYADSNEDGLQNELDKSVVVSSAVYDYNVVIEEIIDTIANKKDLNSTYFISQKNDSITVVDSI